MQHCATGLIVLESKVDDAWLDYNGHVSDRNMALIFSEAEVGFLNAIEVDHEYRVGGVSVYTVETHVCFIKELLSGQAIRISARILDLTNKAVHLLFELRDSSGIVCATHESLMLHVRKQAGAAPKVCPFGRYVLANLVHLNLKHKHLVTDSQVGRTIGIRRRSEDH